MEVEVDFFCFTWHAWGSISAVLSVFAFASVSSVFAVGSIATFCKVRNVNNRARRASHHSAREYLRFPALLAGPGYRGRPAVRSLLAVRRFLGRQGVLAGPVDPQDRPDLASRLFRLYLADLFRSIRK